jgi:hypothetical protein
MDTFPALVIYTALLALSRRPASWADLHNGENILFSARDFDPPFRTPAWELLASVGDAEVDHAAQRLMGACDVRWQAHDTLEALLAARPRIEVPEHTGAAEAIAFRGVGTPSPQATRWWELTAPAPGAAPPETVPPGGTAPGTTAPETTAPETTGLGASARRPEMPTSTQPPRGGPAMPPPPPKPAPGSTTQPSPSFGQGTGTRSWYQGQPPPGSRPPAPQPAPRAPTPGGPTGTGKTGGKGLAIALIVVLLLLIIIAAGSG